MDNEPTELQEWAILLDELTYEEVQLELDLPPNED